jgi:hypothetical protein
MFQVYTDYGYSLQCMVTAEVAMRLISGLGQPQLLRSVNFRISINRVLPFCGEVSYHVYTER